MPKDLSIYSENARRVSALYRDRPMSPMDTAVYWVEYVIRHRGAPHLRSAGADMPLYQYLLLDVITVLLLVLVGSVWVTCCAVKVTLRLLCGDKVVYWVEYVIRHRGAPHLRSAGADMPLYQYLLLDVITVLLLVLVGSVWVACCAIKVTLRLLPEDKVMLRLLRGDKVVYWVEYVIRHRGAPHLRSAGADMPLYQYLLLDVITVLLLVLVGSVWVACCAIKVTLRLLPEDKVMLRLLRGDKVVYWVEYVIRHRGAPHLRSAGADMPLYQYLLLDVITVLLLVLVGSVWVACCAIKVTLRLLPEDKVMLRLLRGDKVVYWVEYVIRHRGAPHLRSAGADMPLYQYLLLDVITVLLLVLMGSVWVACCAIKVTLRLLPEDKVMLRLLRGDKVVYWVEYAIRHRGAPHLRSAGADMPLYQYLLLDVITVLLLVLVGGVWVTCCAVKVTLRLLPEDKVTLRLLEGDKVMHIALSSGMVALK